MTDLSSFDIVIQGAGPVGLACAGWLLQNDPELKLALLDKNPEDDAVIAGGDQRGIAISEGSRLLLETLGAWPSNCPAIYQVNVSQRGYFGRAVMTREEIKQEALGHIVRYAEIHLALRQSLKKMLASSSCPNFQWLFNSRPEAVDLSTLKDDVCVIHAEGGLFSEQQAKDRRHDYQQSALIGWVTATDVPPNQAWERFTPEGPLALLPSHLGAGHLNLVWCGNPENTQRRLKTETSELLRELQTCFGDLVGQFTSIHDLRAYPLGLNIRNEIVDGRDVWIGNAAQTLHPVAGQGLNLGLRDAATLINCISPIYARPHPSRKNALHLALQEYAKLREGDRKATIASTDLMARVFTSKSAPLIFARGLALSGLQWMPAAKSALARQMMFGQR
jgi:2-octaprenyl-6-methoxyphenol hydroxylase